MKSRHFKWLRFKNTFEMGKCVFLWFSWKAIFFCIVIWMDNHASWKIFLREIKKFNNFCWYLIFFGWLAGFTLYVSTILWGKIIVQQAETKFFALHIKNLFMNRASERSSSWEERRKHTGVEENIQLNIWKISPYNDPLKSMKSSSNKGLLVGLFLFCSCL